MTDREIKKKLIIWFMTMMLINWSLLACAWVKMAQRQTDPALVFIIIYVIANVIGYRIFMSIPRE